MRWLRNTKNGSYIVEAVIAIPVFIMAVLMLMSIVPIAATCENITFSAVDEMQLEMTKSAFRENPLALPAIAGHRIKTENPKITSFQIRGVRYLYTRDEIDDLISLEFRTTFSEKNPLGLFSHVVFDGKVTGRAFTGKLQKSAPGAGNSEDEEDKTVYIFPEWGERYHGKQCTYVKANCQMVYLSQNTKRGFKPCKLCHAKSAPVGSPVFCFMESGKVYHLAGCRTIDKYYVEASKKYVWRRGIRLALSVEVDDVNGRIEVRYEEGTIHSYIMDILNLGLCNFFFKGSFVSGEEKLLGSFQTEGFRKLESLKEIGTEDILNIAIAIVQGAMRSEKHYIFSEEYEINCSTVFVDKGISTVKLLFMPSAEKKELTEKMVKLLFHLKEQGSEEGQRYIENAISFISDNGFNYRAVIHHLETLRREVYLCSIA